MTVPDQRILNRTIVEPWLTVTNSPSIRSYHIGVKASVSLEPGDYVQIVSHVEGTNDLGYNCMFARYLKESPEGVTTRNEGTDIARAMGMNITPDMHHGMLETMGDFVATQSRAHNFLLCLYAASSAADPGDQLKVEYAEMRLAVWRSGVGQGPFIVFGETEFGE